jgi:hypothetical protein
MNAHTNTVSGVMVLDTAATCKSSRNSKAVLRNVLALCACSDADHVFVNESCFFKIPVEMGVLTEVLRVVNVSSGHH